MRVQDTEIYQADDPKVLEWAAKEERILLSHDIKTMPKYAYERIELGIVMSGLVVIPQSTSIKQALEELSILIGAGTVEDFENQVRYIPLT